MDGEPLPTLVKQGEGPLYTAPWHPEGLARGLHTIEVFVQVSGGRAIPEPVACNERNDTTALLSTPVKQPRIM